MKPIQLRTSENGSAVIEFAIVIAVFVVILLATFELGMVLWEKNTIAAAAREGARFAIVRGSESGRTTDTAGVAAYVRGRAGLAPLKVLTTWPVSKDPGATVEVRVEYMHKAVSPLTGILQDSVALASTSRMVVVF